MRGAATGHMPLHQRLGNDWLALNLRLLFGLRLSDDGPFRAVRTDLLERLRLEERAYAFPTEMAVKARLAGARIAVRDTRYRRRGGVVQDRRHLARLGARRAGHLLVPAAPAAVRVPALTGEPAAPGPRAARQ